jgi:hypothetical protein
MEGSHLCRIISPCLFLRYHAIDHTKVPRQDPENDSDTTLTRARTTSRTIIYSDVLGRELLFVERLAFQL